jgi:Fe-S cluster biogenesis protein NfuA
MPTLDPAPSVALRARVEEALERLRPALQADGGDVELVEVEGSVARIKMVGACLGCPMSVMTLKAGIEAALVEAIPEIRAVEAV